MEERLDINAAKRTVKGRFAPSPSGRMHLGNVYAALMSWLSAKSKGGKWLLRIEDLDPQRSKTEYARLIEDDLERLGLCWDEGGLEEKGDHGPYCQSERNDVYRRYFEKLADMGLCYPCACRRADIMATQAPHQTDGRIIYSGRCRPAATPPFDKSADTSGKAVRLYVPDRSINFTDEVYGAQNVNLTEHCGDFVIRRADGAWAYQLAVVVDDALMGVTEVVRANDLLLSTGQQIYLYGLLGFEAPTYIHLPLLSNAEGQRLSKRDHSLAMDQLLHNNRPEEIIGRVAYLAGIISEPLSCRPDELLDVFDIRLIMPVESITVE